MQLTTRGRVKLLAGVPQTVLTQDALIDMLVVEASAAVEEYMDNRALYDGTHVEDLDVDEERQYVFKLGFWPVASIVEVRYDPDREFGATTLLDVDDYRLHRQGRTGLLEVTSSLLLPFVGSLRVTYAGGLGTDVEDVATKHPSVVAAATAQASYLLHHAADDGVDSMSSGGGAHKTLRPLRGGLVERAAGLLRRYRRMG